MIDLIGTCDFLIGRYTLAGLLLLVAIVALTAVQLCYWAHRYARIARWRNRVAGAADGGQNAGVTVVVVVRDDYDYITQTLPLVLAQAYEPFEVVVVDLSSQQEVSDQLAVMRHRYPHLRVTRMIQQEQRFAITQKMALNVGIKAASYPNIVLTTSESYPVSDKWLALMAKGFSLGGAVIGYTGIERRKGLWNSMQRCGRLMRGMNYLSSAIARKPYRGLASNLGYTAGIYFSAKGFDHLNLEVGDDDLFVQRIADKGNTVLVMNPRATMRQRTWGGVGDWFRRRVSDRRSWRHYPLRARSYVQWELGSRVLLYAACVAAIVYLPFEISIAAGALLVFRMALVQFQALRVGRRLGEKGLVWAWIPYDIFSPLWEAALWTGTMRARRRKWN